MRPLARVFAALLLALGLLAAPAFAQTSPAETARSAPDYQRWQQVAQRAEGAVDAGRASDAALEAVRAELARFRQQFVSARDANADRIRTIQSQIDALGAAPAEGATEAPDIAARRAELSRQLADLRAPGLAAEEAFNQANGLIGEIDQILAQRRASALLTQGPSPMNPVNWGEAARQLAAAAGSLRAETQRNWGNAARQEQLRDALPVALAMSVIGLVLIVRGRRWSMWIGDLLRRMGGRGTGVWSFVVSLGRVALPVLGLIFLTEALLLTGLVGLRGTLLLENLPQWGLTLLSLRWLCERLFSRRDEDALIQVPAERRSELRFYGTLLAVVFVARDALAVFLEIENASEMTAAVAGFPLLVIAALVLFRLGQILSRAPLAGAEGEAHAVSGGFGRILRLAGQASILVALVSPVVGALGYMNLAGAAIYPVIMTLALFGLVVVLQRFFADLYGWLSGQGDSAREALVPVLIGFLLVLAAVPVLALIWGARPAELIELWAVFNQGFSLGATRISPTNFLTFAIIFAVGYTITRLFQGALKTSLLPKTRLDAGGQNAIVSGTGYLGVFLAAIIAITAAGIDLSGLAIVAGALSVGIGFGLQNIVSNFVSGIILLVERPIAEGDWIEVNGNTGYVRNISVRSTRIETFDRSDVIVPNADLVSGTVTNFTRGNTVGRVIVPVGVAYGTDTRKVEAILREVAENHPMVLAMPAPNIIFQGFGADSLNFEIRAILRDVNWSLSVRSDMNHEIARRFTEEGIEIPFAQRDIWIRNPEALRRPDRHPPETGADDGNEHEGEGRMGEEGHA